MGAVIVGYHRFWLVSLGWFRGFLSPLRGLAPLSSLGSYRNVGLFICLTCRLLLFSFLNFTGSEFSFVSSAYRVGCSTSATTSYTVCVTYKKPLAPDQVRETSVHGQCTLSSTKRPGTLELRMTWSLELLGALEH